MLTIFRKCSKPVQFWLQFLSKALPNAGILSNASFCKHVKKTRLFDVLVALFKKLNYNKLPAWKVTGAARKATYYIPDSQPGQPCLRLKMTLRIKCGKLKCDKQPHNKSLIT